MRKDGEQPDCTTQTNLRRYAAPTSEDLPTFQIHYAKRERKDKAMDPRLGHSARSGSMGEPIDGLGIERGLHAGYPDALQNERSCCCFCEFLTSLIRYCANTTCCAVRGWRIDVRPRSRVGTTWFPSRRRQRFHQRTTVRYSNSPMPP